MHQSISYVDFECKSDKGSEVYLVDDPKPTHVHDIKVMNILKPICTFCAMFQGVGFGCGVGFSTIYLNDVKFQCVGTRHKNYAPYLKRYMVMQFFSMYKDKT